MNEKKTNGDEGVLSSRAKYKCITCGKEFFPVNEWENECITCANKPETHDGSPVIPHTGMTESDAELMGVDPETLAEQEEVDPDEWIDHSE